MVTAYRFGSLPVVSSEERSHYFNCDRKGWGIWFFPARYGLAII